MKLKHILSIGFLAFYGESAQAAHQEEPTSISPAATPHQLVTTYLEVLGQVPTVKIKTAQQGLKHVLEQLKKLPGGGKQHTHIQEGCSYGTSFIYKNEAPIQDVADFVTGRKNWKKSTIEGTQIFLADVGCGLGLSAARLIDKALEAYHNPSSEWQLKHPLSLDLLDFLVPYQPALQAFATLVNDAYPQYFKVNVYHQDITQPLGEGIKKNIYHIVTAFNVLHYIPESNWKAALAGIESLMKDNGMLYLTADHYAANKSRQQVAKMEEFSKKIQPFSGPNICLVNPKLGPYYSTIITNVELASFLKEGVEYAPNNYYSLPQIDPKRFLSVLKTHIRELNKPTNTIGLVSAISPHPAPPIFVQTPLENIMKMLEREELKVMASCYGFNDSLFRKAISSSSSDQLKELDSVTKAWSPKLMKDPLGNQTTVGVTYIKKPLSK